MHCIHIRFRSGTDNHSGVIMKFTYELEPETGELLIFRADISLFINEDYEGNKYPEVEYANQQLFLHLWSDTLDEVVEIPLEVDGDVFIKYIKDNKELEQAALNQLLIGE